MEYSSSVNLQTAQQSVGNGNVVNIEGTPSFLLEILGNFPGLTCHFERSLDDGITWSPVALTLISDVLLASSLTATATGIYRMEAARGWQRFRCRTAGSTVGSVTVKAYGLPRQGQP